MILDSGVLVLLLCTSSVDYVLVLGECRKCYYLNYLHTENDCCVEKVHSGIF